MKRDNNFSCGSNLGETFNVNCYQSSAGRVKNESLAKKISHSFQRSDERDTSCSAQIPRYKMYLRLERNHNFLNIVNLEWCYHYFLLILFIKFPLKVYELERRFKQQKYLSAPGPNVIKLFTIVIYQCL